MVSVVTSNKQIKSKVLAFAVTNELDIFGTNAINALQLMLSNNSVKVRVDIEDSWHVYKFASNAQSYESRN